MCYETGGGDVHSAGSSKADTKMELKVQEICWENMSET